MRARRVTSFGAVILGVRLIACGGDASTSDPLFGGTGQTAAGGDGSAQAGNGTSGTSGTAGETSSGGANGVGPGGGSSLGGTSGATGGDPFGGVGGSAGAGVSGNAGAAGAGFGGGPGPGPGGAGPGPGPGGSGLGGGGKGGATGGTIVPKNCKQAHDFAGCCGPNDTVYFCNQGSNMVTAQPCTMGMCSWDAVMGYYGCMGLVPADPTGQNPRNCGP